MSLRLTNWDRPFESALKPGTLAPPCCGGVGIVQIVFIEEVIR